LDPGRRSGIGDGPSITSEEPHACCSHPQESQNGLQLWPDGRVNLAAGDAIIVGVAFGWAKGDIMLEANGGGPRVNAITSRATSAASTPSMWAGVNFAL
jgi:hypothetical protein